MPAVLPLMRAASRSSTRRRSSTPRKRREAPSIPAAGQNVACKSSAVRICVEGLVIMLRVGRFCHALVYGNHVFQPTRLLADRSALLARDLLAPIVHDTAYEAFREISPLLGSRSGLSTA